MKIDFVIPWVDGSDPKWLEKKSQYQNVLEDEDGAREIRFRDWDNLRYWFRGVEKFAPWVNKVYFVTCGQIPDWLNTKHEKLVCIDHKDYIPEKYLPVFSSHPIELNFNRIKELSEHFVYFNDDVFLTSPVKPENFFVKGLPCDSAVESPITPNRKDTFNDILMNNMILINEHFNRRKVLKEHRRLFYSLADKKGFFTNLCFAPLHREDFFGFEYAHLAVPLLKSTIDKLWEISNEWLDTTCQHRFRHADDVNQYIFRNYQYVTGKFHPYSWRKKGHAFQVNDGEKNNVSEICDAIRMGKYQMICINEADVVHFEDTKEKINQALNSLLSEKSEFEK